MINFCSLLLILIVPIFGQDTSPWVPDNGDGTFKNPIIYADYSDPDVIRVGDDFFMTSSSFNCVPALPILHSKDLVNWKIVNYAIKKFDDSTFNIPQHGNGVWAPSIRFHDGFYYIYWGDPDRGIFMVKTADPYKDWDKQILVKKAYGNIDACPLWDDDGKVYLVHAFAHSRAGVKSILQINEMTPDGTKIIDKGRIVFDGHDSYPTIEGPKIYKKDGYYYIFAPAGGVAMGWQTILRSKNIYGPYKDKIVLEQGSTSINGPHQGSWVSLDSGEDWFVHFQDRGAYGRIVHLNLVKWVNDWPLMGVDYDRNGIGEPVSSYRKPDVGKSYPIQVPQTSDEFNGKMLGLQWQWQANYKDEWFSLTKNPGNLRLLPVSFSPGLANKWLMPNMLLQKFPAEEFDVSVKLLPKFKTNEKAALVIMGLDYAFIQVENADNKLKISMVICENADQKRQEKLIACQFVSGREIYFRINVRKNATCQFSYSINGEKYRKIGEKFKAREGKWIGAKTGLFTYSLESPTDGSYVDVDWFKIHKIK